MIPKNRIPTHPGEILREEFLRPLGTSQTRLAAHIDVYETKISAIINGVNVRSGYDRLVRTQATGDYGAYIWYQHWWNDELRSTLEASGFWSAINTNLLTQGTTNNKLLGMAHANLFWSPVAFVDFGVEYSYGHRVTVAGERPV